MTATAIEAEKVDGSYDIVIIGAGISGINAAFRIQEQLPHLSYTILEAREVSGGTWSLFKYPGIRSDSEIASFAFSWAPWDQNTSIADGPSILRYLETTAEKYGINKKIQFDTRVTRADWQSPSQRWSLTTTNSKGERLQTLSARFVMAATGYYDYATPQEVVIPGIEHFMGDTIHPQFWPTDFNCRDKNVVIIGSGATAVTLVPSLATQAKQVTMLQRSPGHFLVMPSVEHLDNVARRFLPAKLAYSLIRLRILILGFLFVRFCHYMPGTATKLLRAGVKSELPPDHPLDPHFTPKYNPFEQRLCIVPDGDFFRVIREGKARVVTGTITAMKDRTITVKPPSSSSSSSPTSSSSDNEETVVLDNVDVIVTATGLKISLMGGMQPTVDGKPIDVSSKFAWRSTCLQDIPNLCFTQGYIDNAWTLGSDSAARLFVRLIQKCEREHHTSFVPVLTDAEKQKLVEVPMIDQSSGYFVRARHLFPRTANKAPWKPRWHYFEDYWFAGHGSLTKGMKMVKQ